MQTYQVELEPYVGQRPHRSGDHRKSSELTTQRVILTFASLLLQQSESSEYVRAQMGHASISITVDFYGPWLRKDNLAAIDRPDDIRCRKWSLLGAER